MKFKTDRYEYIDCLRAVAILFVVIFHYTYHYETDYLLRSDGWTFKLGKYGWSGVDIFFIVSGYCIGMTIVKTKNFFEFSVRRFARLYPGYLVCGIATMIFYSLFDLPGREVDWFTGFMNLIFANFIPGLNYKYIDGIYWALIVEIKFYLFFGIIFFLIKDIIKSINTWFVFCLFGNLVLLYDKNSYLFFTSIFPHANLFLIGLTLFFYNKISFINKILIFIFIVFSLFTNERYSGFEYYFVILVFLVSILLLKKIDFKIKFLSYLGVLSYTWYLTHNAIGIIIIREINKLNYENFSIIFAALVTLALSMLIYNFIEIESKSKIINFYKKIRIK